MTAARISRPPCHLIFTFRPARNCALLTGLLAGLLLCLLLGGCGLNVGRPIEKGEGDGSHWAPDSDGKFIVIDVHNQFTEEIEFVAHGRPGIFRLMVEPGKKKYMVLKDVPYTRDLRTRKEFTGQAEYQELEERVLGVRRLHIRVLTKGAAPAK